MMGWFQALMPKEEKFYDLFESHATTLVHGAKALDALLSGQGDVAEQSGRIYAEEENADRIAAEIGRAVRRTFITPFDRGDIKELVAAMDDAIDQMRKTAKAINLFEQADFPPMMRELGKAIEQAAEKTADLVPLLRKMNDNASRIAVMADAIAKLEERSDELHDLGLKELYQAHRGGDAMAFIVGVEIYGHLEKVVDRFEDVANCISGIVIEHI